MAGSRIGGQITGEQAEGSLYSFVQDHPDTVHGIAHRNRDEHPGGASGDFNERLLYEFARHIPVGVDEVRYKMIASNLVAACMGPVDELREQFGEQTAKADICGYPGPHYGAFYNANIELARAAFGETFAVNLSELDRPVVLPEA